MVYAAIDIHESVFQAAVLDTGSGEITDARFVATPERLRHWAMPLRGRVAVVAIEATTVALGLARAVRARLRRSSR